MDDVLLPVWERVKALASVPEVVVMSDQPQAVPGTLDYEALLAGAPARVEFPASAEGQAAGLCYTSGTTGRPKGVLYSHRALVLHALTSPSRTRSASRTGTASCRSSPCST